jgi:tetratricopeptide (TPR) repeat protein
MYYWFRRRLASLLAVALALALGIGARLLGFDGLLDQYFGWIVLGTSAIAFLVMFRIDRHLWSRRTQRFYREYRAAIARGDFTAARRYLESIYGGGRFARDLTSLDQAAALSQAGRFDESARLLEAIPRERIDPRLRPSLLRNLAWARVRNGKPGEAVALAREALAAIIRGDEREVASTNCALGLALVLAGSPAEAVPVLSNALTRTDIEPDERATAACYLGLAYEKIGWRDEARQAFMRAMREAPASEAAKHAHSYLTNLTSSYPESDSAEPASRPRLH